MAPRQAYVPVVLLSTVEHEVGVSGFTQVKNVTLVWTEGRDKEKDTLSNVSAYPTLLFSSFFGFGFHASLPTSLCLTLTVSVYRCMYDKGLPSSFTVLLSLSLISCHCSLPYSLFLPNSLSLLLPLPLLQFLTSLPLSLSVGETKVLSGHFVSRILFVFAAIRVHLCMRV